MMDIMTRSDVPSEHSDLEHTVLLLYLLGNLHLHKARIIHKPNFRVFSSDVESLKNV